MPNQPIRPNVTSISNDDHLWVVPSIPWIRGKAEFDDVKSFLMDPQGYVDYLGLHYFEENDELPVRISDHYFVVFKTDQGSGGGNNIIEGIHGTGMLSVCSNFSNFGTNFLPPTIPSQPSQEEGFLPEKVEVSLLLDGSNRAFVHCQIGSDRELVVTEVMRLVSDPAEVLDGLTAQYARIGHRSLVWHNATTRERIPVEDESKFPKIRFEYKRRPEVYFESCMGAYTQVADNEVIDPPIIACAALIGNYYIDVNGHIVIVVDSTLVKMYV